MFKRLTNWIKDGIYKKSDIFVALIIICLAAGLITWRINIIMTYPQQIATQTASQGSDMTTDSAVNTDNNDDTTGSGIGQNDSGVSAEDLLN